MTPVARPASAGRRSLVAVAGALLGLLALLLLAVLGPAAPALAGGSPVEGAPTPDAAPVLAPGSYTDTVRSGETLYYGVRLELGQRAKGRFTVDGTKNPDPATMGGGDIHAVTADGDEYSYDNTCCHHQDAWTLTADTGLVGAGAPYGKEAGLYYFKFQLTGYPTGLTLPVQITIVSDGQSGTSLDGAATAQAPGSPASGASGSPPEPSGASQPAESARPMDTVGQGTTSRRFSFPVVAAVGALGLVLGVIGGGAATVLVGHLRSRR